MEDGAIGLVVADKACQKRSVVEKAFPQHPWIVPKGGHVFVQTYPDRFRDDELESFLDHLRTLPPLLPAPYGWVVDLAGLFRAPMRQKSIVHARQDENREMAELYNGGTAIVADNAIKRGLVRASYMIKSQVFPVKVVASVDEGIEWVRAQLAERGVTRVDVS